MTITVVLMTHPKRAHFTRELIDRLDVDPTVIVDRWDSKWDTGRRALLAADMSADYVVVVQDDAVVPRDFAKGVAAALEHVPAGHPAGLFLGTRTKQDTAVVLMRRAREQDARWVVWPGSPMWGVGLAIPTDHVRAIVKHGDRLHSSSYDGRVRHWYQRAAGGLPTWYPLPSLVDHRNGPENPSLVSGRHSDGRRAHWFIGVDASPLDVDWDGPVVRQR